MTRFLVRQGDAVATIEAWNAMEARAKAVVSGDFREADDLVVLPDFSTPTSPSPGSKEHPVTSVNTNPVPAVPSLSQDERAAILDREVAKLARDGWTVSSVTGGQAVLQRRKRLGWFWNIVLSVLTSGLWLLVVLYKVLNRKTETRIVAVDDRGHVSRH